MSAILKKGSFFGLYIRVFFKKGVYLHRLIFIDNWKMQKKLKNMYSTNISLFNKEDSFFVSAFRKIRVHFHPTKVSILWEKGPI